MRPADEMMEAERALCEALGRCFPDPGDKAVVLTEFAKWSAAFSPEATTDPALRDIMQGRRQAFFWLADRLQLSLPLVYERYLQPSEVPYVPDVQSS